MGFTDKTFHIMTRGSHILIILLIICGGIKSSAQSVENVILEKPGKLSSLLKGKESVSKLILSGTLNEKDIEFVKSLPNLKVLDVTHAFGYIKKANQIVRSCNLDTLYLNSSMEMPLYCGEKYWNITPTFVVKDGKVGINKVVALDNYDGIQYFPINTSGTHPYRKDALYLNDAIEVQSYFSGANIKKVYLGKNLQKVGEAAFWLCRQMNEVEFGGGNMKIERTAFDYTFVKRVIVPKGYTQTFASKGISKSIITEVTPSKDLKFELTKPGTLASILQKEGYTSIKKLLIVGKMDFSDLAAIRELRNLEELELSGAYIAKSEADRRREVGDMAMVSAMYDHNNKAKLQKDLNIQEYQLRKKVNKAMDETIDQAANEPLSNECELPRGAFKGLSFLTRVAIPAKLSKIGYMGSIFEGCINLKEIWCSKETANKINLDTLGSKANAQIKYY